MEMPTLQTEVMSKRERGDLPTIQVPHGMGAKGRAGSWHMGVASLEQGSRLGCLISALIQDRDRGVG